MPSTASDVLIETLHDAESLAKGEPNKTKIVLSSMSDKVRELI